MDFKFAKQSNIHDMEENMIVFGNSKIFGDLLEDHRKLEEFNIDVERTSIDIKFDEP